MGQLWVSASHLWDANQRHKLRDQPLGQRYSSASEWLFKHRDARIDFFLAPARKRGGRERGVGGVKAGVYTGGYLQVWMGAIPSPRTHPPTGSPSHPRLISGS